MYIVGQASNPADDEELSLWAINIHKVFPDKDEIEHLVCIEIYDITLNLCLLKAKSICDLLNQEEFVAADAMINKLTDAPPP